MIFLLKTSLIFFFLFHSSFVHAVGKKPFKSTKEVVEVAGIEFPVDIANIIRDYAQENEITPAKKNDQSILKLEYDYWYPSTRHDHGPYDYTAPPDYFGNQFYYLPLDPCPFPADDRYLERDYFF